MDALETLRQMHVEAKSAFQHIEQAGPDQRGQLWTKLEPELKLHEQAEERCVYDPAAQELGSRDQMLQDWHQRHHQEVGEAERMIGEIDRLNPQDSHWLEMVTQLRMTLERHIQTEEGEIWPHIRQVWGMDKLDHAGTEIEKMKRSHMGERAA